MLPPVTALSVSEGTVTVQPVAAGAVPATAKIMGGIAVSQAGVVYVVVV